MTTPRNPYAERLTPDNAAVHPEPNMRKLLVLGAAGKVGRLTTALAQAAGLRVTAFARRPESLADAAGCEPLRRVAGDLRDAAAVDAAIAGQDAVVCTFGAPLQAATVFGVPDLCRVATGHVLLGMARHRVDRLVCLSAIGVGDSRGHGRWAFRHLIEPLLLRRIFVDRERQEELVRASPFAWSIVRPAELTDEPASGDLLALDGFDHFEPGTVPRADVAAFLVREARDGNHLYHQPVLTSRRSARPRRAAAAAASRPTGRSR